MSSSAPSRPSADDSFASSDEESFELIDGKSPVNRSSTPSSDSEDSVVHTDGEEEVDYPESPAPGDGESEEMSLQAAAVKQAEDALKAKFENQVFEWMEKQGALLIKNELAEKELARLRTQVVELKVVGDMMEMNHKTLTKENRKLMNELDRKGATIFDMGEELNKTMVAKNTLEREQRTLKLTLDQMEARLAKDSEEKKGLEAEMAQQAAAFEERHKNLLERHYESTLEERNEYSRRFVGLQKTINELTGRLEAAEKETTTANEQKEEMQIRLSDVDAEAATLRGMLETFDAQQEFIRLEHEAQRTQMEDAHRAELQEAREAAETAKLNLEQLVAEQKEDIDDLMKEMEATGQYLESVMEEKELLADTVRRLVDEAKALEEAKADMESAHSAELEAAKQEAVDAKRAIDKLTVEHNTFSETLINELDHNGAYVEKVLAEKEALAETVCRLEGEAKALKESKAQLESAHSAELEAAKQEAADAKRAIEELTVDHNTFGEALLNEIEQTGACLEKELEEKRRLTETVCRLEEEVKALEESRNAKHELKAAEAQINIMSGQLATIEAKQKAAVEERDDLAEQLAEAHAQCERKLAVLRAQFAQSVPSTTPASTGNWACPICCVSNKYTNKKCECCGECNPVYKSIKHWECRTCCIDNKAAETNCICCGEAMPMNYECMVRERLLQAAPENREDTALLELSQMREAKLQALAEVESLKKQLQDTSDTLDIAYASIADKEKELAGLRATATNYQAVYDSKLIALRPHCDNLRAKAEQCRVDGNTEAARKMETMIDVLEGRRSVSLDYLGNLEAWIQRKADFLNHRPTSKVEKEEKVEEEQLQKKVAETEQRAEWLDKQLQETSDALDIAHDAFAAQEKELSALRASSETAAADYKAACDERDFFRKSLKTVTEDLEKMEGVEERLRSEVFGMEHRAERLEKELEEQREAMKSNCYEMCRQATKHAKQIAEAKRSLEKLQQEKEDTEMGMTMRIEHLEKEIESLASKIIVERLQSAAELKLDKVEEKPVRTVRLFRGENGQFGMKKKGCIVHKVFKDSSAEVAGVKRGDEIVSIDGVETATLNKDDLRQLFEKAEESIELGLVHNSESIKSHKLSKKEQLDSLVSAACDTMASLAIAEPEKETRTVAFGVGENGVFGLVHTGTSINSVVEGGAAEAGGVQRGDQIMVIDGVNVEFKSEAEIEDLFAKAREAGSITMELRYNIERLRDLEANYHN